MKGIFSGKPGDIKVDVDQNGRYMGLTALVFTQEEQCSVVKLFTVNLEPVQERINLRANSYATDIPFLDNPDTDDLIYIAPFWAEVNSKEKCLQVSGNLELFFDLMMCSNVLPRNFLDCLPDSAKSFIKNTRDALPLDPERNTKSRQCVIC